MLAFVSSFQKLFNRIPDYLRLRVFGCSYFSYLKPYHKQKVQFHTAKCVFLGYLDDHKGYKCLHSSRRVYDSASVKFNEEEFPFCIGFPNSKTKDELAEIFSFTPLHVMSPNISSSSTRSVKCFSKKCAPSLATSLSDLATPQSDNVVLLKKHTLIVFIDLSMILIHIQPEV